MAQVVLRFLAVLAILSSKLTGISALLSGEAAREPYVLIRHPQA